MYFRYLSKLTFDQLLYTDTDSVIMYRDFNRADHVMLPTSDLLDVLKEHPTWYVDEVIAFGPKMYHLILRDKISGKVVKWNKTMKGISEISKCTFWDRKCTRPKFYKFYFKECKTPTPKNPTTTLHDVTLKGSNLRHSELFKPMSL